LPAPYFPAVLEAFSERGDQIDGGVKDSLGGMFGRRWWVRIEPGRGEGAVGAHDRKPGGEGAAGVRHLP
jgi:hypothetical protein